MAEMMTVAMRAHSLLHAVFGPWAHYDSSTVLEVPCPQTAWPARDRLERLLIDKSCLIPETADGHTVVWSIRQALEGMPKKGADVIIDRFFRGMLGDQVAHKMGLSRSRIGQLENKALRRLRHPTRVRFLRCHLREYERADIAAFIARLEIAKALEQQFGASFSYHLAARITRKNLAAAWKAAHSQDLKEVGRKVAASCHAMAPAGPCYLCSEPALPGSECCLVHIKQRRQVPLVCDWDGKMFTRKQSAVLQFVRAHGRTQHQVFCTKAHFYLAVRNGWLKTHRKPRHALKKVNA